MRILDSPFKTVVHNPLYVADRTALPQLIWSTTSRGVSVII
jgi:hypothetical protein